MKRVFIPLFSLVIYGCCSAQSLNYVIFSNGSDLSSFSFITDQRIIIRISQDGKILEWGNDLEPGHYYYQPGKLQSYLGRVDKYGPQFDSAFRGKVKSIGTCSITYFGSYENAALVGKIKSIGNISLDYFTDFENESLRGKLKTAGPNSFNYYSSFENEAYRGKVKSIGSNQITYYSTFDDKLVRGKLKSIGAFKYVWYTSYEINQYHGGLKSGSMNQMIEGVAYLIW